MKISNNKLEIQKDTNDSAYYTGTVTVSTYLGDRLIQTEKHHNAGLTNLFEFIGNCLQGNWMGAKYTRPCKLVLLRQSQDGTEVECLTAAEANEVAGRQLTGPELALRLSTPDNPRALDDKGNHFWSSKYAVCSPIMYDNAALSELSLDTDSNEVGGGVTYHFRVPFLSLVGGSVVRKLLLLPSIVTDYAKDACAYFILKNEIKIPEESGNFTVIIDWKLTFTNIKPTAPEES
jgi:hypothetical protein